MKKFICVFVCLMTMVVSANAQNLLKIKQLALNEFKQSLNAPSQFILTDKYGNRISVSQLDAAYLKATYDTIKKYDCDSVVSYKRMYEPCYIVTIIGDAMNSMGGYIQIVKTYYVYNNEASSRRLYKETRISVEKYNRNEELNNEEYDVVEQMPSFPNGMGGLMKWIKDNMKYPVIAVENGIQGRVIVQLVIEKDGTVTDVHIAKSVDPSLDKEAIRLAKMMPKWIPGKSNGSNVRCKYTIPITFKL